MSVLARTLSSGRAAFNRRVEAVRRAAPGLDADWFARLLREGLAPLVEALDGLGEPVGQHVATAFDLGLELACHARCKGAQGERVTRLWRALAPHARELLPDFRHSLARLTNSLFTLEKWRARPDDFLTALESLPPGMPGLEDAVVALAWRSGIPMLRLEALRRASTLPRAVAETAFGAPAECIERWLDDPWWEPSRTEPRIVGWLGGFLGDGGSFPQPPRVVAQEDGLLVTSGDRAFGVFADRFGQILVPVAPRPTRTPSPPAPVRGRSVLVGSTTIALDFPPEGLSAATFGRTTAACSPVSFRICLIAS